jgi:hypothetical protein
MYSDTDIVVKQKFVREALATNDPDGAVSLCQVDRNSRRACGRFDLETKADLCLRNDTLARHCDNVPIYSKEQFLSLVPPVIEIDEDDPLQLRYEFYSQNYKLPTEGFAEALFKAKTLNTSVALLRPFDLLKYGDRFPPLPPNISAYTLDDALKTFKEFDVAKPGQLYYIMAEIDGILKLPQMSQAIRDLSFKMHVIWDVNGQRVTTVWCGVYVEEFINDQRTVMNAPAVDKFLNDLTVDKFIRPYLNSFPYRKDWASAGWISILGSNWPNRLPNSFVISRLLYKLLSAGLAIESISYDQFIEYVRVSSNVVYHKPKKIEAGPSIMAQPAQLSPGAQDLDAPFGN